MTHTHKRTHTAWWSKQEKASPPKGVRATASRSRTRPEDARTRKNDGCTDQREATSYAGEFSCGGIFSNISYYITMMSCDTLSYWFMVSIKSACLFLSIKEKDARSTMSIYVQLPVRWK